MVPIIAQTAQVILVAMTQEIAVPSLILLSILKVVDSNVRICDVTHFSICLSFVFDFLAIIY